MIMVCWFWLGQCSWMSELHVITSKDMWCYVKHVALCGCLSVALECGENNNGGWGRIEVCYLSQCLQLSPLSKHNKVHSAGYQN
jgi:hypothetical protein